MSGIPNAARAVASSSSCVGSASSAYGSEYTRQSVLLMAARNPEACWLNTMLTPLGAGPTAPGCVRTTRR